LVSAGNGIVYKVLKLLWQKFQLLHSIKVGYERVTSIKYHFALRNIEYMDKTTDYQTFWW
jgi:hypothetical protein